MEPVDLKKKRRIRPMADRMADALKAQARAAERLARKTAKVQKYEATRQSQERKLDTRRKIIAGALALEHMRYDPEFGARFRAILDEYVTREEERILFGLPPLDSDTAAA